MKKPTKKYGFIEPDVKVEDYFLGQNNVPTDVLRPDGQWDDFLPSFERQQKNFVETSNCTAFGSTSCIEILYKRLYGEEENYSDRYVGILAGTGAGGNSPDRVLETIRKESGLIGEKHLPFSDDIDSIEKYYSPKPMPQKYLTMGLAWLRTYEFKHEWVFDKNDPIEAKHQLLKEALKYSPIGISVYAWKSEYRNGEKFFVKDKNTKDNHWVVLYGYKEGEYWKVFDSYENDKKKLDWNFNFLYAKRIYLSEKKTVENNVNLLITFFAKIANFFRRIFGR